MWQLKNEWAVGGLLEAGFHTGTDLLMVLSGQGRGIFDCMDGIQIARDNTDFYRKQWDAATGIVTGFGPLEGSDIICGGFEYPNILPQDTIDGWEVKRFREAGNNTLAERLCISNKHTQVQFHIASFPFGIHRAYGFSDTGRSFIAASSSDLIIWSRRHRAIV